MGPPFPVDQCRLCGSVSVCRCIPVPTIFARVARNAAPIRRTAGASTFAGLGFSGTGRGDGSFSWTGGAGAVGALGNPDTFPAATHGQMGGAPADSSMRLVLNDNNGNQFRFRKAKPGTNGVYPYWPGFTTLWTLCNGLA